MYSVGARTLPCGRPARKGRSLPLVPLTSTDALRSPRNAQIQETRHPGSLRRRSFRRSILWSMTSYALEKSKARRANFSAVLPSTGRPRGFGLFQPSWTRCTSLPRFSSADLPLRKPTCSGGTSPSRSARNVRRAATRRSASFARWLVRAIGLWLVVSFGSLPALGIGMITALLQGDGRRDLSRGPRQVD